MSKKFTVDGDSFDTSTAGRSYGLGMSQIDGKFYLDVIEHDTSSGSKQFLDRKRYEFSTLKERDTKAFEIYTKLRIEAGEIDDKDYSK